MITTLSLPQGTTAGVNISASLSSPTLKITEAYIAFMPEATISTSSAMKENSTGVLFDTDGDLAQETAVFSLANIINSADGVLRGENDKVQLKVIVQVVDTYGIVYGSTITASLIATYLSGFGSTTTLNQLSSDPLVFTIAGPNLIWTTYWNSTSADAGGVVSCAIHIEHANTSTLAAYLVDVVADLHPYMQLVSGSVVTDSTNFTSASPVPPAVGLVSMPIIELDSKVWVNFTATLTSSVVAGSFVNVSVHGTYATAPSNGSTVYVTPVPARIIVPAPRSNISLGNSSIAETSDAILSIGEYFSHYVTLYVSEGTTLNPAVSVVVPADLMTVLGATVSVVSENIVVNNFAFSLHSNQSSSNNIITATFDSLVNTYDGNSTNNFIIIGFQGVVLPSNITSGTELESVSTFSYSNTTSTVMEEPQRVNNTIVVPELNITEVCILRSAQVQATSEFTCTLTVSLVNMQAPVYDLVIKNVASPDMIVNTDVRYSSGTISTTPGVFAVAVPLLDPASPINIVVEYNVTLNGSVKSGAPVVFAANVSYLSSPTTYGASYAVVAEHRIDTLASGLIIAVNTSDVVSVGDTVSLLYTIDLIEGITPNTSLVAKLSSGLSAMQAKVIAISANCGNLAVDDNGTITDADGDGTFDTVTLLFGDLCNPHDGAHTAADKVVVEVIVHVDDTPFNTVGTTLVANGILAFNNYTTVANTTLRIEGPELAWTVSWDKTSGDAGDTTTCSVVIQHAANSSRDAFNVDLISLLAPNLQLSGSVSASSPVVASYSTAPPSWTSIGGIASIPLGLVVRLNFSATFTTAVVAGSNFSVAVSGNFSSAATRGRVTKIGTDVANFTVPAPTTNITIASTSNIETVGSDIVVGEIVTTTITINIPEGTTLAPRIAVNVSGPTGVSILEAKLAPSQPHIVASDASYTVSASNGSLTNNTAIASFSSLVNQHDGIASNDKAVLSFTWVVLPWANVSNGDIVQVQSYFEFSSGSANNSEAVQVSTATVLVQNLQVYQSCTSQHYAQAGSQFTCFVTIAPTSAAPIYNLSLASIPTIHAVLVGSTVFTSMGNITVLNKAFTLTVPVFNPATDTNITIEYGSAIDNTAQLSTPVVFSLSGTYHTSPSQYGAVKAVNTTTNVTMEPISISGQIVSSSLSSLPSANVSIGEQVTVRYTLSVPTGTAENVNFRALAVEGLSLLSSRVVSMDSFACTPLGAGYVGTVSDPNGDGWNEEAAFPFDSLCNNYIGVDNTAKQIVIEVVAAVVDVPSTQFGSKLPLSGVLSYNSVNSSANAIVLVITQPELQFNATPNATVVPANSVIHFSGLVNSLTSTAAAYALSIVSAYSPFVQFISGCGPSSPLTAVFADNIVEVNADSLVLSSALQFGLCARVLPLIPSSSTFNLSFTLEYRSAPSSSNPSGRVFNVTASGVYSTTPVVQTVAVASTSNFPGVPGNHNVSVGDTIALESVIMFPAGTTISPNFTLVVPASPALSIINSTVSATVPGVTVSIVAGTVYLVFPSTELEFSVPVNLTVTTHLAAGNTSEHTVGVVEQHFTNEDSNNFPVSTLANVSIYVNPLPEAQRIMVLTPKNTPVDIEVWTESSSPDQLQPDSLYTHTQPGNGTAARTGTEIVHNTTSAMSVITYTPITNFVGVDRFTYTIKNAINGVSTGQIIVQVAYFDFPPVLSQAVYYTYENIPVEIDMLAHAYDVDGTVSLVSHGSAQFGNLTNNVANNVTFVPPLDWSGVDSFDYTVTDGLNEV